MSTQSFLRTYRTLFHSSESNHLKAMRFLVSAESQKHLWRGNKYETFKSLLVGEKLCTWSLFTKFKKAVQVLDVETVTLLGVYGSSQFATLTPKYRRKVLRGVKNWAVVNNRAPNYQTVSEFIKNAVPRPKRTVPTQVEVLRGRVRELETEVKLLKQKMEMKANGNKQRRTQEVGLGPQSGAPQHLDVARSRSGHRAHDSRGRSPRA